MVLVVNPHLSVLSPLFGRLLIQTRRNVRGYLLYLPPLGKRGDVMPALPKKGTHSLLTGQTHLFGPTPCQDVQGPRLTLDLLGRGVPRHRAVPEVGFVRQVARQRGIVSEYGVLGNRLAALDRLEVGP